MSQIKHTPTPWVFDPTMPTGVYSDDATGSRVATTGLNNLVSRDPKEDEANAAFIVTAVNAYDKQLALIDTLQAAVKFYADAWCFTANPKRPGLEWKPKEGLLDDCGNVARDALAAIKEISA